MSRRHRTKRDRGDVLFRGQHDRLTLEVGPRFDARSDDERVGIHAEHRRDDLDRELVRDRDDLAVATIGTEVDGAGRNLADDVGRRSAHDHRHRNALVLVEALRFRQDQGPPRRARSDQGKGQLGEAVLGDGRARSGKRGQTCQQHERNRAHRESSLHCHQILREETASPTVAGKDSDRARAEDMGVDSQTGRSR